MKKRENPIPIWRRELLRKQEVADMLGIGLTTLQILRREDKIPKPEKCGASLFWRRREIQDWISAGMPPRSRWRWEPSELMPVADQVRLKKIELANLEIEIARRK